MTHDGNWIVYTSGNPAKLGVRKIHPDGSGATSSCRVVPPFQRSQLITVFKISRIVKETAPNNVEVQRTTGDSPDVAYRLHI